MPRADKSREEGEVISTLAEIVFLISDASQRRLPLQRSFERPEEHNHLAGTQEKVTSLKLSSMFGKL